MLRRGGLPNLPFIWATTRFDRLTVLSRAEGEGYPYRNQLNGD
jgi:hypothetical protein